MTAAGERAALATSVKFLSLALLLLLGVIVQIISGGAVTLQDSRRHTTSGARRHLANDELAPSSGGNATTENVASIGRINRARQVSQLASPLVGQRGSSSEQRQNHQQPTEEIMISCEELGKAILIVDRLDHQYHLSNSSLAAKLAAECVNQRSQLESAASSTHRHLPSRAQSQHRIIILPKLNSELSNTSGPAEPFFEQQPTELHFGAKVTLTLLVGTVGLVLAATLADYAADQHQQLPRPCPVLASESESRGEHEHHHHHHQAQCRDQRSPSLSSSGMPSLLCGSTSAFSIASSSEPIYLARRSGRTQIRSTGHQHHGEQVTIGHYEHNIQMGLSSPSGSIRCSPISIINNNKKPLISQSRGLSEPETRQNSLVNAHLFYQLFLAFSMRRSAQFIFKQPPVNDEAARNHAQNNAANCRNQEDQSSVVMTASDLEWSCQDQVGCCEPSKTLSSNENVSIDSLHGLKFLSMIWIIVIHSYSFARSWQFFANSSTLANMYKTAASQWLANGTFACDTFFFASGFLLSHLALGGHEEAGERGGKYRSDQQQHHYHYHHQHQHQHQHLHSSDNREVEQQQHDNQPNGGQISGASRKQDGTCSEFDAETERQDHPLDCSVGRHSFDASQEEEDDSDEHDDEPGEAEGILGEVTKILEGGQNTNELAKITAPNLHPNHHQFKTGDSKDRPLEHNLDHAHDQTNRYHHTTHDELGGENTHRKCHNKLTLKQMGVNLLHRYIRMMPLMMAIIGLSSNLLRYLGQGPAWDESTIMFDKWCRSNWWVNALFLHNFVNRENMCLSHSWYSAVDIQLFLVGQLVLFLLIRNRKMGLTLLAALLVGSSGLTGLLTMLHHLPAVPLISSFSKQAMNLYYGHIYIKPYCRAAPYLIGLLMGYLMQIGHLKRVRLQRWQASVGWTVALTTQLAIVLAMKPAMNGSPPTEIESALYSALSRPLWACSMGWIVFACVSQNGGVLARLLEARCFIPLSRLTYPAFLIHPIVMATFYGSRQSADQQFQFSHHLMLYLILGNIVITYASAFFLSALFELPLLSCERVIRKALKHRHKTPTRPPSMRVTSITS